MPRTHERLRRPVPVLAAFGLSIGLLSACSSTGTGEGLEETASSLGTTAARADAGSGVSGSGVSSAFASAGEPAPYCPKVQVREGTNILDRQEAGRLAYSANIVGANANCRIVDGQLRMKVDVGGRISPGPAGPGAVQLPVRVVVLRGKDVIYSELGKLSADAPAGGEARSFTYSDPRIAFAVPKEQNIEVFTGFDEGPPK